jgi:hypothetical protein
VRRTRSTPIANRTDPENPFPDAGEEIWIRTALSPDVRGEHVVTRDSLIIIVLCRLGDFDTSSAAASVRGIRFERCLRNPHPLSTSPPYNLLRAG